MERACESCERPFLPKSRKQRFCSSTCRQRSYEARKSGGSVVVELPVAPVDDDPSVLGATLRELRAVGRESSARGRAALAVAARLDLAMSGRDTGSAFAALVREHRAALEAATEGAAAAADPIDELRAARDRRRAGA